ncbi:UNKNOWN [Stylonychia lemnae]|uniref:YHYH domain-containing protein n=1 Tax=Stylonychia lemnae TaxID=5949 RepID=A0A078A685_STYLE|nr:UNKNOWN [Stylonychia lemnae]|eukprot:CDW76269.1 UNKNOWN [Stylonychia lemnae]
MQRIKKKLFFSIPILLILFSWSKGGTVFGCYETALAFKNTCNGAPYYAEDWNTFVTRDVTCNQMQICPVGSTGTAPNCTWKRKLCVTCSQQDGQLFMRIQSNGLPDHCVPGKVALQERVIDVKFRFDPPPVTFFQKPSNVDALNHMICDFDSSSESNLPSDSMFRNYGEKTISIINMVGIAANGVPMYNGNSPRNTDYFYPKDWAGSNQKNVDQDIDACLGAIQPEDGVYHYWFLPPCLYHADKIQTSKYCDNVTDCFTDMASYSKKIYTDFSNTWTLIGMAKDGHKIIGPYTAGNSEFDCQALDICNGIRDSSSGNYTYVAVTTFPYVVGCYGPGAYVTFNSVCSKNVCSFGSSLFNNLILFGLLAILMLHSFY